MKLNAEQIGNLVTDDELNAMRMTREQWIKNYLEEQDYTNAWADRVRFTLK